MQQHPNNSIRNFHSEKQKGIIGSLIMHSVLLLALVFVGFKIPPTPDFEEGILVNFGTDETGFGLIEPAPLGAGTSSNPDDYVPVPASTSPPASAPASRTVRSNEEALLTQDFEEAPEVRRADPNAERRRAEQAEADRVRRENLENERRIRAAEEAERQRVAAEQRRETEIADRTRNAFAGGSGLAGSRNVGSDSNSEGIAGGAGNQGVLTGSLDSRVRGDGGTGTGNSGTGSGGVGGRGGNRVSYSLGGRSSQSLPNPNYNCQEEGVVIVQVRVNAEGRVTQAEAGRPGSTSLADCLTNAAREAALQTRFAPSNEPVQVGTITYNFRLN